MTPVSNYRLQPEIRGRAEREAKLIGATMTDLVEVGLVTLLSMNRGELRKLMADRLTRPRNGSKTKKAAAQ